LKLQEAALNKQAEAKRQGYEGNTSNTPATQQGNNGAPKGQDQSNQGRDDEEGYVPSKGHITAMIQRVPKSNKEEKSITRQVNLAITSPPATREYLHWSEQPIEFSRDDHPITIPRPGNAPLVLKAQIGTYDVDRIFMDARSGINLIYAKTLRAMHISLEFLKPTDCSIHEIVPGSANCPLGRIALNVCFGNRRNYRREKLDFEVMDWPSQYHAILGRPAFSRFMAVPHYTYLVLKMPGPKGVIRPMRQGISQDGPKLQHDGKLRGTQNKKHDYRSHAATRRKPQGTRSKETSGTATRSRGVHKRRREGSSDIGK
jgi:hypothetical protein